MIPLPRLLGGAACLDFANTVDPRHGATRHEYLSDYAALIGWSRHAGLLGAAEAEHLLTVARRDSAASADVLERAIALREAIYRIFAAVARGDTPEAVDLTVLNVALPQPQVVEADHGFAWGWPVNPDALERPLWPVAWSAAELLVTGERERIKECPGADDCGWLFLDRSKNGTRRYCSADGCGNRVRARRHYARSRGVVDT